MKLSQTFFAIRYKKTGELCTTGREAPQGKPPALYATRGSANRALPQKVGHKAVPNPHFVPGLNTSREILKRTADHLGITTSQAYIRCAYQMKYIPHSKDDYEVIEVVLTEVSNGE